MKKCEKHLLIFFAGTLAWTWTIGMIPVILGINNTDYGNLIFVFTAGIAPSSMGLIMVFATYSPEAKKKLFQTVYSNMEWLLVCTTLCHSPSGHINCLPYTAPKGKTGFQNNSEFCKRQFPVRFYLGNLAYSLDILQCTMAKTFF